MLNIYSVIFFLLDLLQYIWYFPYSWSDNNYWLDHKIHSCVLCTFFHLHRTHCNIIYFFFSTDMHLYLWQQSINIILCLPWEVNEWDFIMWLYHRLLVCNFCSTSKLWELQLFGNVQCQFYAWLLRHWWYRKLKVWRKLKVH